MGKGFMIRKGILKKYTGPGGNVIIPEGITGIGSRAFDNDQTLTGVVMPDSVELIRKYAFNECGELSTVTFSSQLKRIDDHGFCRCCKLQQIVLPSSLESIGRGVFYGYNNIKHIEIHSSSLSLPEEKLSIFLYAPVSTWDYTLFAPHLSLEILRKHGLEKSAAKTFIERYAEYDEEVAKEYIAYISAQRNKYLPIVLENDDAELIQKLIKNKKITKKNYLSHYLLPARQCRATACTQLLETVFGKTDHQDLNPLWDGKHYSFDGKKLLQYCANSNAEQYVVPEGTQEICHHAFVHTPLRKIILPETVIRIQNQAFIAKSGQPLYIKLPNTLQKLPSMAFGGDVFFSPVRYYIETCCAQFAEQVCCSSFSIGRLCPIYTGGPLEDLSPDALAYAVDGFLYATEHHTTDLSAWKASYIKYIKANKKSYLKYAPSSPFLIQFMIGEKLLTPREVEKLLQMDTLQKDVATMAALLNYQSQFCNRKGKTLVDPLSDDSKEFQKVLQKQARMEQLEAQEGIAGIVFVASGSMERFGYYDDYTFTHNLSDLKEFIEARGGFLRSAVSFKTDYLICNDVSIQTTKVKKAQDLGIQIITEEEFMKKAQDR
jgi:hypothetical protein